MYVDTCGIQGLSPEVIPSTFEETLPFGGFRDIHEYPVATASQKAVEVYERLVVGYSIQREHSETIR